MICHNPDCGIYSPQDADCDCGLSRAIGAIAADVRGHIRQAIREVRPDAGLLDVIFRAREIAAASHAMDCSCDLHDDALAEWAAYEPEPER